MNVARHLLGRETDTFPKVSEYGVYSNVKSSTLQDNLFKHICKTTTIKNSLKWINLTIIVNQAQAFGELHHSDLLSWTYCTHTDRQGVTASTASDKSINKVMQYTYVALFVRFVCMFELFDLLNSECLWYCSRVKPESRVMTCLWPSGRSLEGYRQINHTHIYLTLRSSTLYTQTRVSESGHCH